MYYYHPYALGHIDFDRPSEKRRSAETRSKSFIQVARASCRMERFKPFSRPAGLAQQ